MRRAAAAPGAAAAAVEDRQLDAVPRARPRRAPPARGRSPTAPRGSRRPCPSRSSRPSPRHAASPASRSARRRAARRRSPAPRSRSSTVSKSGTTASGSSSGRARATTSSADDVPETISVSSAAGPCALAPPRPRRPLRARGRSPRSRACRRTSSFATWKPNELDHPLEPRDAAVGDARAAVRRAGCARISAQVVEQLVGGRVAVVAEPPPHERELAPVRLELVPRADLGRVVRAARARRARATPRARPTTVDERARASDLDRERAHLVAVAAERERRGRGRAPRRSTPARRSGCRPCRRRSTCRTRAAAAHPGRRSRQSREQLGRRVDQAVLEEPEPVADLVRDAQAVVAHLVGLPEERHLLGDALLGLRRAPLGRRAGRRGRASCSCDPDVREQHGAPRRLRRMRGQHELDRRAARPRGELVGGQVCELGERVVERLARDAAVVRVLAPPPQAVVLLGEVRELEVEANARSTSACASARPRERRVDVGTVPARRAARVARGSTRRARAATRLPARRARGRGSCRAAGRRL